MLKHIAKFIFAVLRKYTYFVSLFLTLREEEGLSVLENEVLRKIYGSRRIKMAARYTKLNKYKLCDFYLSNIIGKAYRKKCLD
jgi:hypothetical protein